MARIIDIMPITDGLFKKLSELDTAEWLQNYTSLDLHYVTGVSGLKTTSPLIDYLMTNNIGEQLSNENLIKVANIILQRYKVAWDRKYALLSLQYNPIENYSMQETETPNLTETVTHTNQKTETPNITKSTELKKATDLTVSGTDNNESGYAGFNSALPNTQTNNSGDSSQTTIGDAEKNKETGTETESGTRKTDESANDTKTNTGTRTLSRSGNIGVTTSQQMAQSEIELWQWTFIDSVFKDIDTVITCPLYEF